MPQRARHAECRHPAPIRQAHRFPEPQADGRRGQRAHRACPEERCRGAVLPRHIAGQQPVQGKHQRRDQGDHRIGREHPLIRLQDDEHADESHPDGRPAPPAHVFAKDRPGQRRDQQRIGRKDRVALDQPKVDESQHHHVDLDHQQHTAKGLQQRLPGPGRLTQPPGLARRDAQHEKPEEPIADHHHHGHVVGAGQMPGKAVLNGEDNHGHHHQDDAEAGVLGGHRQGFRATVM